MGTVIITFKVLPEDTSIDLKKLQAAIAKKVQIRDAKEEPIAFGLKALVFKVFVEDSEGGSDAVEEKIRNTAGVAQVEITGMDRI